MRYFDIRRSFLWKVGKVNLLKLCKRGLTLENDRFNFRYLAHKRPRSKFTNYDTYRLPPMVVNSSSFQMRDLDKWLFIMSNTFSEVNKMPTSVVLGRPFHDWWMCERSGVLLKALRRCFHRCEDLGKRTARVGFELSNAMINF